MFNPTKPFNDRITNFPDEPSLRIGRVVPPEAVNLAYYYNKCATDAEKILAAEAPRKIIDHRVEEAYRYLFDQTSDDDDLFPKSVWYEDEEGYSGRLGRMYVNWYPKVHVNTKHVSDTKVQIVNEKNNVLKMIEYSDAEGFKGNIYLDAVDYEVTKEKDVSVIEELDYEVYDHELSYHEIHGSYLAPGSVDDYMVEPGVVGSSVWPKSIEVTLNKFIPNGGTTKIQNFVKAQTPHYDDAVGQLVFDHFEYEPVPNPSDPSTNGRINVAKNVKVLIWPNSANKYGGNTYCQYDGDTSDDSIDHVAAITTYVNHARNAALAYFYNTIGTKAQAEYQEWTDEYLYGQIEDFLDKAVAAGASTTDQWYRNIQTAMDNNKDIVIYFDRVDMVLDDASDPKSKFHFEAKYKYKISDRGTVGSLLYNVIACYKGILKRQLKIDKKVPAEYKATCIYTGIARLVWYTYDGMAYYRGSVTKGNATGNVNPENDNELLMYPDEDGFLRMPRIDVDGNHVNFYKVESDQIYLTDVFKDGIACFYKYPLKKCIYDYRGPDIRGFYEGDAVKMFQANMKDLPHSYVHNIKLVADEFETKEYMTPDYHFATKQVPMRYKAEVYCSFISSATDTAKITYNAFNDSDKDNIALENGVTEDVYNYPFMHQNIDYRMVAINPKTRENKIQLINPVHIDEDGNKYFGIPDTRQYVTFSYKIVAERPANADPDWPAAASFETPELSASILNKDYALQCEHNLYKGRAMIISPEIDGLKVSPKDLILHYQSIKITEETVAAGMAPSTYIPVISSKNAKYFTFKAVIVSIEATKRGSVNVTCNADGSGYLLAETTVDTGFYDTVRGTYTKQLSFDNPYIIEFGMIYPGFKVKCIDTRLIKCLPPREERLLDSWYPRIQFGHYSQVFEQYGANTKIFYTMPEYDTQHWGIYGKPFVDIENEQVEILNPHMVKTLCYPIMIRDDVVSTKLYKKVDNELFELKIKDISFSDGIIITESTVSENDCIICNYTYLEESYVYRGYWRTPDDFCRLDLNPNKYHTYSDLNYIPSEIKPSKNLFNKVIYFFMHPTTMIELNEEEVKEPVEGGEDNGNISYYSGYGSWYDSGWKKGTGQFVESIEFNVYLQSHGSSNDSVAIFGKTSSGQTVLLYNSSSNTNLRQTVDLSDLGTPNMFTATTPVRVKVGDFDLANTNMGNPINIDLGFTKADDIAEVRFFCYTDHDQACLGNVTLKYKFEYKGKTHTVLTEGKTLLEYRENTLYHKFDDAEPNDPQDIYIGSIYIRQNTSLHSTIIVDSRTRGGGVLESIKDDLRHSLESESDYYLDIGYYDGEPYQENGVIIVRLDNQILKEFGGKFTPHDVEVRVNKWKAAGVYPIIEYVDSYNKYEMPQYNLEVTDGYSNMNDLTPEILLENIEY